MSNLEVTRTQLGDQIYLTIHIKGTEELSTGDKGYSFMKQLVAYQRIVNTATVMDVFIIAYAASGLFCNFICYASTLGPQ